MQRSTLYNIPLQQPEEEDHQIHGQLLCALSWSERRCGSLQAAASNGAEAAYIFTSLIGSTVADPNLYIKEGPSRRVAMLGVAPRRAWDANAALTLWQQVQYLHSVRGVHSKKLADQSGCARGLSAPHHDGCSTP